jgi:opacity protein-like surface antigen
MKKLLTATLLAVLAASPAMAAKARNGKVYLQSERAYPSVPYGVSQQGAPIWSNDTWSPDPNIRDRQDRDYPDFH